MKWTWWKILCMLLLLYSFSVGMLVPLKPGMSDCQPRTIWTDTSTVLNIVGYNTLFSESSDHRAWLKIDSVHSIEASKVNVLSDRNVEITFNAPSNLPGNKWKAEAALIIDNSVDGSFVLPGALDILDTLDQSGTDLGWDVPIKNLNRLKAMTFPYRTVIYESIRNTFYHVPLWFAMMFIFAVSAFHSARFIRFGREEDDLKALSFAQIGILFGILGTVTGMLWAKHTWGAYWSFDIKQNMTAVALFIYIAYLILRNSFNDPEQAARLAAPYNIFAFAALIPLLYIIPRFAVSLHPGSEGNPAFGSQDLDNTMRMIFYPSCVGFILLAYWISNVRLRIAKLDRRQLDY